MTGGLLALNQHPGEFAKLRANPALIDSLVPEIIRWQTPLAHMRRTALQTPSWAASRSRRATRW
jgi:cytochrome P450